MHLLLICMLSLAACAAVEPAAPEEEGQPGAASLRLEEVAGGLSGPVFLTTPRDDPRLFVVEQPGRIRIIDGGRLLDAPFLDIVEKVGSGGERGLLSIAFHPSYATNGRFYVNYTDRGGTTRVERYAASADPGRADPASATAVLSIEQPFSNHNGGLIRFGPDGMLYIGMGDGGSAGDPLGHGQDRGTLLGALLRIDVDRGEPYAVPPDNPFVGTAGARPEIWAYGLRNPWRFAFDRAAGLLYIADVGQNRWEEVNVADAAAGGLNYGWNVMEGAHCYARESCDAGGLVLPALEYDHSEGCSVTGGAVYRGAAMPALNGHYFYGDYCGGWIRSFRYADGDAVDRRRWDLASPGRVLSFGEDSAGELYVLSANGRVYRLASGG